MQMTLPVAQKLDAFVSLGYFKSGRAPAWGQIILQPHAQVLTKTFFLSRKRKVHAAPPSRSTWSYIVNKKQDGKQREHKNGGIGELKILSSILRFFRPHPRRAPSSISRAWRFASAEISTPPSIRASS